MSKYGLRLEKSSKIFGEKSLVLRQKLSVARKMASQKRKNAHKQNEKMASQKKHKVSKFEHKQKIAAEMFQRKSLISKQKPWSPTVQKCAK